MPRVPTNRTPKRLRAPLLVAPLAAAILSASPSHAATATGAASCEILPAIGVAKTRDLAFGQVQAGGSAGLVVLAPGGVRTAQGGTALAGGSAVAASILIGDSHGASYSVTVPPSIVISDGIHSMLVTDFTVDAPKDSLDPSGFHRVSIGATLHVAPGQVPGQYLGTLVIAVAYD